MAAPPKRGELAAEIECLAAKTWRHPTTGVPARFSRSTIERWYYQALFDIPGKRRDPVEALARKVRSDSGRSRGMSAGLKDVLLAQHRAHPSWSYRLHADNLAVTVASRPELGSMPAYRTLLRFMRSNGLVKRQNYSGRKAAIRQRVAAVRRF